MALKPTIYKAQVNLADSDRNCYEQLSLTLARHPSETLERTMVRLLAFCLNSERGLSFSRGLSSGEEPELWQHSDSGDILKWIEVGQPDEPRLRKACGRAGSVLVYTFGKSADTWWQLNRELIEALPRLEVWQLDWDNVVAAAAGFNRNAQFDISVVGGVIYIDDGERHTAIEPRALFEPERN